MQLRDLLKSSNHGYLAVDFFFLLSGFVIGYAYDDRWSKMSIGDFFKRRLIRLQPMVVIGALLADYFFILSCKHVAFNCGDTGLERCCFYDHQSFMLPVPSSVDIRGWTETYPLNGPAWSLFFEYIANILYAIDIRKFPKWLLAILVFASAMLPFSVGCVWK